MRRSITALAICALVAALAGVASAALPHRATIVPGRSIAGVRLGMSIRHVERIWGKPSIPCGGGLDGRYYCGWYPPGAKHANGINQLVTIAANHPGTPVVMVDEEFVRGWKTRQGIGVGSTKAALLRAYGAALVPGHIGGAPTLDLETVQAGQTVWTRFVLSARDRRTIIEVGLTRRHGSRL